MISAAMSLGRSDATMKMCIRDRIEDQPDITLAEMREALELPCTLPAIYYVLRGMKLTYKKNAARQRARARRRQAAA